MMRELDLTMKTLLIIIIALITTFPSIAQNSIDRPKLVVGIIVDQMRQEYLYRFYDKFGEDGFRKLMNHGFMLKNAHFNYVPTYTGPGHASIFTGTTPNIHGIIGNNWFERAFGREINCVTDTASRIVGGHETFGPFSPVNLRANTITDELKIFSQGRSKIIGISLKNRGAILPAGHMGDAAYWFDEETFNFVSSTYYMETLPPWLKKFNGQNLVDSYLKQRWETVYPIEEYTESGPDDTKYELVWTGRNKPTFPYDLKKLIKNNAKADVFKNSPFGDNLLTKLARDIIINEDLGSDNITDVLTISYSSSDRVGHKFGPNSVEIEDTYIRLDRHLADLFAYLDDQVGAGDYLVFLSTDHGVADVPRMLHDNKIDSWYIITDELKRKVGWFLNEKYGEGSYVKYVGNEQIYFDYEALSERNISLEEISSYVARLLQNERGIRYAIPAHSLHSSSLSLNLVKPLSNGYNPARSGDVLVVWEPGWIPDEGYYYEYGTRHGSHFTYDTHAPVLFYGWGITPGSSVRYHPITDIAPTLSMLLNIRLPNASTGQPIEELFED